LLAAGQDGYPPVVPCKELSADYVGEKSEGIRKRVVTARNIYLERFKGERNIL
jgi:predicted ATPase with chaperone activity